MDLAECIARSLAIDRANRAPDRLTGKPVEQIGETWQSYHREALQVLDDYGRAGNVQTAVMASEIESARLQLAAIGEPADASNH